MLEEAKAKKYTEINFYEQKNILPYTHDERHFHNKDCGNIMINTTQKKKNLKLG